MFRSTARLTPALIDEHKIIAVSLHDEDYQLLEWRTITCDERPHEVHFSVPSHWKAPRCIRMATWSQHGLTEWVDRSAAFMVRAGDTLTCTLTSPSEWTVD